ncbi:MAG: hypothetical protein JO186_00015 [Actinobacteria bacterium]|nr:hypothetical protein [Actinomycetota bacterium]
MSDRRILAVGGAVAAIVLVLLVGTGLGWWNGAPRGNVPAQKLAIRTSLTPRPAFFGDEVTAEIDVDADTRFVSAKSLRVLPAFDPFVETRAPTVSSVRAGRELTVRYRYTLQCSSDACVPVGKPLAVKLPSVTVTAGALRSTATWPPTEIVSRLQPRDLASSPHFRTPRALPAPAYSVSPNLLADVLTGVAAALALGAAALGGVEFVRFLEHRRRRRTVRLTPLEAALAYTRDAARRPDPADRRKALAQLARVVDDDGIDAVAWAAEDPSPERALSLADEVEQR